MSFSKKFLNFDFLSKLLEFKINVTPDIFYSIINSIIFRIFSLNLDIIINFSFSNSDLFIKPEIKLSLFKISFSSYLSTLTFKLLIKYFSIISFLNTSFTPYKRKI